MTGDPGYARRAASYAGEIATVPVPEALAGLLATASRVVEVPSGTGHFLAAYAEYDVDVLLVDASEPMLEVARANAPEAVTLCRRIEDLTFGDGPADLVVMPNAALNQLAISSGPSRALASAARLLPPVGHLLAQVMTVGDDGSVAECGFYDPSVCDGELIEDRRLQVADRKLIRHRRQMLGGGVLQLELEFHDGDNVTDRYTVELLLLSRAQLIDAVTVAGLDLISITAGPGGLTEVLLQLPAGGAA